MQRKHWIPKIQMKERLNFGLSCLNNLSCLNDVVNVKLNARRKPCPRSQKRPAQLTASEILWIMHARRGCGNARTLRISLDPTKALSQGRCPWVRAGMLSFPVDVAWKLGCWVCKREVRIWLPSHPGRAMAKYRMQVRRWTGSAENHKTADFAEKPKTTRREKRPSRSRALLNATCHYHEASLGLTSKFEHCPLHIHATHKSPSVSLESRIDQLITPTPSPATGTASISARCSPTPHTPPPPHPHIHRHVLPYPTKSLIT